MGGNGTTFSFDEERYNWSWGLTVNVADGVVGKVVPGDLCEGPVALGPGEADLVELAVDDLHEAVRVAVVVDRRALRHVPAQQHQVVLTVTFVHQVPCVPAQHSFFLNWNSGEDPIQGHRLDSRC